MRIIVEIMSLMMLLHEEMFEKQGMRKKKNTGWCPSKKKKRLEILKIRVK